MAASWKPGDAVLPETGLEAVLHTIGCGQNDFDSFAKIADKLKTRNVTTAGNLFGNDASWSREELLGCLKNLELRKSPLAYVTALETVVGHAVGAAPALQLKTKGCRRGGGRRSRRHRHRFCGRDAASCRAGAEACCEGSHAAGGGGIQEGRATG